MKEDTAQKPKSVGMNNSTTINNIINANIDR